MIDELLKQGADPNATDFFERTPLCLAAHQGYPDAIKTLCKKMNRDGRDRRDIDRRNALHYAILNQKEEAALCLIEHSIDTNAKDRISGTPLWYAAQKGMERVVESILKNENVDLDSKAWIYRDKKWVRTAPDGEANLAGHTEISRMIRERRKELKEQKERESEGR